MSEYSPPSIPPPESELLPLFIDLNRLLADEDESCRGRDSRGFPGGVVDLRTDISTIVLPDIHARPCFVRSVLDFVLPDLDRTVEEAVLAEAVQLVCVGDYFHGEGRVARRWQRALQESINKFEYSPAMDAEMAEGLEVLLLLGRLKLASPSFVQLLKGNHENAGNEEGGGNHRFREIAFEGDMVETYLTIKYGEPFLSTLCTFEKSLPLVAVGNRFVISHAEPEYFISRERVVEYRNDPEVIYALTWTMDGAAEDGCIDAMLDEFLPANRRTGALWFGGHRPVSGRFYLRNSGTYVQFHNPNRSLLALLPADRSPDPEQDILDIGEGQDTRDD